MKKNFFKKLSFVMALAMLICAIAPAAGVFAAATPALNATTKYLHLSGISGPSEYDFNVTNKQTGWKYAWTSANKSVAVVESNGLTTAVGVGTTKVTVKITNGTKTVKSLSATVTVRDNIETVKIANAPTADLKVGATHDFNRSFVTESNSTTKTSSVTRWTVDSDKATIDNAGVFKATVAGEYKVTAYAFQSSAKYDAWLVSKDASLVLDTDEVTVKVVPSMTEVKQADLDTVTVTFDSAMTNVDKNVSVYQLVGTTEVKQTIKEVKLDDAKKVASVTLYVPFTADATYVVKYTDLGSKSFVAAQSDADDVAAIQLVTTTVTKGTGENLKVALFNKDGVEITTDTLLGRVTFASSSDRSYLSGKNLTLFATGDTTVITATYHTYNYANGVESGNLTASGTVTAVDASSTVIGATTAWTLAKVAPDWANVNHAIAAEDGSLELFVKVKSTTGTTANTDISSAVDPKITFTTSDNTVLIINGRVLTPVKAGSAVVVVNYDGKVVDAITINVTAKRAATTFAASVNSISLSTAAGDSKNVDFTLKDQLGTAFDFTLIESVNVEKLTGSPDADIVEVVDATNTDGDAATIKFTGVTAGTYYFKVSTNNLVQYITVTVTAPTTGQATPTYYKLDLSATAVDLKLSSTDTSKSVTIDVFGYASNGVKLTNEVVATGVVVKVTNPDGVTTPVGADGVYALTTVTPSAISGSSFAINKAKVGTYKVTAYKADGTTPLDVSYFTVTNTQVAPVVSEVDTLVTTKTDKLEAVKESFDFSLNGVAVDESNVFIGEVLGTGKEVFVKSVIVREKITDTAYIEHTVTVGYTITQKTGLTIN